MHNVMNDYYDTSETNCHILFHLIDFLFCSSDFILSVTRQIVLERPTSPVLLACNGRQLMFVVIKLTHN